VIGEVGQVWKHEWDGRVTHYLLLEAVDVSLHRLCDRRPEPGFFILSLDEGCTMYVCCDSFQFDLEVWQRLT